MLTTNPQFRADLVRAIAEIAPDARQREADGQTAMFVPISTLAILLTAASDAVELTANLSDTAQVARVIGLEVYERGEALSPEQLDAAARVLVDHLTRST